MLGPTLPLVPGDPVDRHARVAGRCLRTRRLPRVVAILVILLVASCGTGPVDHVRIGLAAPLSGPRADIGTDLLRGAELAVDDLNARGGLLGEPVELVVTDSADPADLPRRLADLAERARVTAVVGPESTGALLGPRSPLTRRQVAAILPSAFAGELDDASTQVMRTVPPARDQALTMARWLVDERQADAIAVLVADPVEGAAAQAAVVDGLTAGGLPPDAVVTVDPGVSQLAPAVANLRRRAPDVDAVFLWGWPDAAGRATVAVRELGWDVQIVVPSSAFVGTFRGVAGDAAEGVVFPFPFDTTWFGSQVTGWMLRYQATYGLGALPGRETLVLDVPVVALASYDAVGAIGTAVTAAGSNEPAVVADALATTTHEGLLQTYDLGAREAWGVDAMYVARIHRSGVVYDVDPRLDAAAQREFWELQVSARFIRDLAPSGPARELVDRFLGDTDLEPPTYVAPLPPPGPVARP